ncbi:MAG: hypothetical protein AWU59_1915 [Methanolobus sp. T82-4]|nr:MAG: hypothetical protein AWU59_1915 [Methanolobus sp. T82-4]
MEDPDQENMDEIEKLISEGDSEAGETMQVCPVCGSTDLYYEAGGVEGLYHCKYCGYIGSFVVDANEEMAKLIRKEYESGATDIQS